MSIWRRTCVESGLFVCESGRWLSTRLGGVRRCCRWLDVVYSLNWGLCLPAWATKAESVERASEKLVHREYSEKVKGRSRQRDNHA
jgi:hypothetical protein